MDYMNKISEYEKKWKEKSKWNLLNNLKSLTEDLLHELELRTASRPPEFVG